MTQRPGLRCTGPVGVALLLIATAAAQARGPGPAPAGAAAAATPASAAASSAGPGSPNANGSPAGRGAGGKAAKLDLNSASEKEIAALPGLDAAKARRIVKNRPYESPGALVDLSIVTGKDFDKFKDLVTAGPAR